MIFQLAPKKPLPSIPCGCYYLATTTIQLFTVHKKLRQFKKCLFQLDTFQAIKSASDRRLKQVRQKSRACNLRRAFTLLPLIGALRGLGFRSDLQRNFHLIVLEISVFHGCIDRLAQRWHVLSMVSSSIK